MTRKSAYILLSVAAVGLLLATACSSVKKSGKNDRYLSSGTATGEERNSVEDEFAALAKSYTPWTDLSLSVKAQLAQPKKFSVSGTAKMINGKAMYISLRVFGIEVASMYADNDSVLVVVKFNNMYCSESMSYLTDTYGLTLADVQAVLLGKVFNAGGTEMQPGDLKNYKVVLGENSLALTPKKQPKGLDWTFAAALRSNAAPSLRTLTVTADSHEPVIAAYGTAMETPSGMTAPWVNVSTTMRNHHIDATLTWDLDKAKWNSGLKLDKPKIPAGSRRISLSKVIEMLKK